MFSSKNKIDPSFKKILSLDLYIKFRVIIKCTNFIKDTEKKIVSLRGTCIGSLPLLNLIFAEVDTRTLQRLTELPQVENIFLDEFCHLCGGMSINKANKIVSSAKQLVFTGKGISIGVIDSGVYPHDDLSFPSNRIKGFYDFINSFNYPYDDNGHGTMISGIISGSGHCSKNAFKGISPDASLYCYKAFDLTGKAYVSTILTSIDLILNTKDKTNISILCMPFEYLGTSADIINLFSETFNNLISNNIIPIVPSGSLKNESLIISGIGALKNCISVGGLDTTDDLKPFVYSSCGLLKTSRKPDISAAAKNIVSLNSNTSFIPEKNGVKIYPPKLEKSYETFSGTSCSCAYIAGICSLIIEASPSISFRDLLSILLLSCEPLDHYKNLSGEGYINFSKLFSTK
ncbi:MAG: S8 family serine peptidase [Clostridiaceae bacterium]